jgi:hypothetical protein
MQLLVLPEVCSWERGCLARSEVGKMAARPGQGVPYEDSECTQREN